MQSAYQVAVKAAEPTETELHLDRVAAGSMKADPRARESALQRFWRRATGAR
jgi:hypothetical protein